jgi:hypothetical protein
MVQKDDAYVFDSFYKNLPPKNHDDELGFKNLSSEI